MPHPALVVVTPAEQTPVSIEDAKAQLRITHSAEDAHIASLIRAATAWAETYTGRKLIEQTVTFSFDRFPRNGESVTESDILSRVGRHSLPRSPLARHFSRHARAAAIYLPGGNVTSVERINYLDGNGVAQELTGPSSTPPGVDYQEELTDDEHALVYPAADSNWPGVQSDTVNAVSVRYVVGYGAEPDDVPDDVRHAIRMRVADMFFFRGGEESSKSSFFAAAEALLDPHVVMVF